MLEYWAVLRNFVQLEGGKGVLDISLLTLSKAAAYYREPFVTRPDAEVVHSPHRQNSVIRTTYIYGYFYRLRT